MSIKDSIANKIKDKLSNKPYSYGESLSTIQDFKGKYVNDETYMFEDNSVIQLTNNGVNILEYIID